VVVLQKLGSLLCVVLATGCGAETDSDAAAAVERPNVIVITIDTLGADRLPFLGFDRNTAPFLADLARESVVFENAWSASSWTAPSTASLFTGLYTSQHGLVMGKIKMTKNARLRYGDFDLTRIPSELETIPTFMKSQGYSTFGIADNMNICAELGFARGFDRFTSTIYKGAAQVNKTLGEWLPEIVKSEPYFVYLHYMDPHAPYHGRAPWYEEVVSPDRDVRDLAKYDSEISYVDQHVREALALLGDWRDSVVVLVADHGEEFGDHGGHGHKFKLYSELTHVPLVMHHPGVAPVRQRVAADVSLVDVLPSLHAMLGVRPAEDQAGLSLVPYYTNAEIPEPRRILMERRMIVGTKPVRKIAVVHNGYKYVYTESPVRRELYHIATDPKEKKNLIAQQAELADRLHEYWRSFDARSVKWKGEPAELKMSEEEQDALKNLGYVGGK